MALRDGGVVLEPIERDLAGGVKQERARRRFECRLDWYHAKGTISDAQWVAGMKLRALWLGAHGAPRVIGTYGRVRLGDPGVDEHIDRVERYNVAIALVKPEHRDAVVTVCGLDAWAGTRMRTRALKDGLETLRKKWLIPCQKKDVDRPEQRS